MKYVVGIAIFGLALVMAWAAPGVRVHSLTATCEDVVAMCPMHVIDMKNDLQVTFQGQNVSPVTPEEWTVYTIRSSGELVVVSLWADGFVQTSTYRKDPDGWVLIASQH